MLLLAGCSSDEPQAKPPIPHAPNTSPVTSTSPSPSPPALPEAARRNTKAGAVAFAHHYIDLVNYATEHGEVKELLRSSGQDCGACREIGRFVTRVYAGGGNIQGGTWRPRSYSVLANGQNRWLVAVEIQAERQVFRPKAGAKPISRTGGDYTVSLYASWKGSGWIIHRLASTR
jgi:Family of unknown function (DUF6318)